MRGEVYTDRAGQSLTGTIPISQGTKPDAENDPWFWNPSLLGVKCAPTDFQTQLHAIDPDLECVWNGKRERWAIWMKRPGLHSANCHGWKLLFFVEHTDKSYAPLDSRTFGKLYAISAQRWGNAVAYFDRLVAETAHDKAIIEADRKDSINQAGSEYFDFMKIKNIGRGNKFVNHVAG